ncbi:MAG: Gfo/Idh/MocA family oxidoreductase, partial [Pseudomonadota bacterium]
MTRRVCIVGAGIGAEHLAGYAALPNRYTVQSVCDLDGARGSALAAKYPGVDHTTDLSAVLSDPQI